MEKEQSQPPGSPQGVRSAALEDSVSWWETIRGYRVHVYSSGTPCIKTSQKKPIPVFAVQCMRQPISFWKTTMLQVMGMRNDVLWISV